MNDEWEGTWGDPERWQAAQAASQVTPPDDRFTLSRRSRLIVVVAVLAGVAAGAVAVTPADDDGPSFAFASVRDNGKPIGFDPCTPLVVVVNDRTGPANAVEHVERAVERVAEASGLDITVGGTDPTRPMFDQRRPARPRAASILVAWSDPVEVPALEGRTLGLAQTWSWRDAGAMSRYAYGNIALDGPDLAERSDARVVAVIMHELAHALGLDHVDDRGELMHPAPVRTKFGPGDLQGLAALGAVTCAGGRLRVSS